MELNNTEKKEICSFDKNIVDKIIIGQDLAYRLNKNISDSLLVYSPIDQVIGLGYLPRKHLIISGIFSTKILDYDDRYAFITSNDGAKIFKRKSNNDGIDIRVEKQYEKLA